MLMIMIPYIYYYKNDIWWMRLLSLSLGCVCICVMAAAGTIVILVQHKEPDGPSESSHWESLSSGPGPAAREQAVGA